MAAGHANSISGDPPFQKHDLLKAYLYLVLVGEFRSQLIQAKSSDVQNITPGEAQTFGIPGRAVPLPAQGAVPNIPVFDLPLDAPPVRPGHGYLEGGEIRFG